MIDKTYNFETPEVLVIDNTQWKTKDYNYIFKNSKKVQLWHGVGFKKVSKLHTTKNKFIKQIYKIFFENIDLLLITSQFYKKELFDPSFKYSDYIISGYPRNDIFFREENEYDLINVDVKIYNIIKKTKKTKIIYTPTFRDYNNFNIEKHINFKIIDKELEDINALMFIKLHPQDLSKLKNNNFNNIIMIDPTTDLYPILKYSDLLITDYSSISMDYLLLNKPIIYFPYDFEKYTKYREFHLEYFKYTPGEKAFTTEELLKKLYFIIKKDFDLYQKEREHIKNIAFDYPDGYSSYRIFKKILNKFFKIKI